MVSADRSVIEKELNQKLFLHPTDTETLLKLLALNIDQPNQAHHFSKEILKIDPYNITAFIIYIDMKHNWLGKSDHKSLLKEILSFEEKYPENGYIDLLLAQHYEIYQQPSKVRMHLQRSIKKMPNLVKNNKLLALYYYYHDHNYVMAKKLFQNAIKNIEQVYTQKDRPFIYLDTENLLKEKYYENIMSSINYQILLENIKTCKKKIKSYSQYK